MNRRTVQQRRMIQRAAIGGFVALVAMSCRNERRTTSQTPMADMSNMKGMAGMSGMKMSASPASGIRLTADQIHEFGVTFDTVKVRPLATTVRVAGMVAARENTQSVISLRVSGYVDRLFVNETGQAVKQGQPVVAVYSPDIVTAEQELLIAGRLDSTTATASSLVNAGKQRLLAWGVSEDQIDRVLQTGVVPHTVTLTAPVSGVVLDRKVTQGQAIQPGDALLSVADLSEVWIDLEVPEAEANDVRVGDWATVAFPAYPRRTIKTQVKFVYPTAESDAHAITARLQVANPDATLKPGMYATVDLTTPSTRVLSVPSSAILYTGTQTVVFVAQNDGSLTPRAVTTGRVARDFTEVLSGLTAGQRIVTSAQYLLDSESHLAEVMKSMIGQGGHMDSMPGMPMSDMPMSDMPGMAPPSGRQRDSLRARVPVRE